MPKFELDLREASGPMLKSSQHAHNLAIFFWADGTTTRRPASSEDYLDLLNEIAANGQIKPSGWKP